MSPYPVILSIENHCNKEQQDVMATLFKVAIISYMIKNFFPYKLASFPSHVRPVPLYYITPKSIMFFFVLINVTNNRLVKVIILFKKILLPSKVFYTFFFQFRIFLGTCCTQPSWTNQSGSYHRQNS